MPQRLARRLVAIEHPRFVEEWCVAGIEIFRLGIRRQPPPAKGNDPAPAVRDRKHQAPPEGIIGLAALVAFLGQARFKDFGGRESFRFQVRARLAPIIRRIAEPVALPGSRF